MKRIFLIFGLIVSVVINAQEVNIIPQPVEMKLKSGAFIINDKTSIIASSDSDLGIAIIFNQYLKLNYGFSLSVIKTISKDHNIIHFTSKHAESKFPKEGYHLKVEKDKIQISSKSGVGAFYGLQTLIQLLPIRDQIEKTKNSNLSIPQLEITDYPRFAYRGMHLDVCRHFFPVSFVKRYIDYLAYHKLNTFHWHLTDDQGWRIEIKKYPGLTSVGSKRNGTIIGRYPGEGSDNTPYGGFYTQEEIKEVVQYAKERYIEVIPEIEMPGHSSAAIAAYPWLSCFPGKPTEIPKNMISQRSIAEQKNGRIKVVQETWGVFDDVFCAGNDSTFQFLENVLDEVIKLFPSKYIHIGGDECPKTHWKICPRCQQRMKELGLKDEHELQSYFIQRIEKYLNTKGKSIIGWDEILEGGLAPNATVMSWRGEQGGIDAAKQHHNVIMTPGSPLYFDHSQSENEDSVTIGGYNPIEKVYAYYPVPKELSKEEEKFILGAQANVWTEYIGNEKKVEYMLFPRTAALSEIVWSPKEKKDWKNFEKKLPEQMKRYEMWGANYSKAYYDLKATVLPTENYNGVIWKVESKVNKPITLNFNGADSIWVYTKPQLINQSVRNAYAYFTINDKQISSHQNFHFNKATGKKITLTTGASKNYPGDGAFTLVNGVINEKGMARAMEFLGFNGTDCEALIDLQQPQQISSVTVHCFQAPGSWIWPPASMEAYSSVDGMYFSKLGVTKNFVPASNGNGSLTITFDNSFTQFVKVVIKNKGDIPGGNAGAGNKAWLFVSEIEVN